MPRSDRGKFYTLGLTALFVASGGGAYWLIGDAHQAQSAYEQQAQAGAQGYTNRAYIGAKRRCVPLAAKAEIECIREEYQAARQGRHDEYDLQAQLVTSAWTRFMGIAAIIGMAVGIFGIGLIFFTFRETRRAADSANSGAKAAQATHQAYVANERVVLRIANIAFYESEGRATPYVFRLHVSNHGRGNAIIQRVCWSLEGGPIFPDKTQFEQFTSFFVKAETADHPEPFSAFDVSAFPIWLMGFIDYETLGDLEFRTHFCYRVDHVPDDGYASARQETYKERCRNMPGDT